MTTVVVPPYGFIADLGGGPLEDGKIYVGTIGFNPLIEANRIGVYTDTNFTTPVAQPVRTQSGLAVGQNGSPIQIFTASAGYSIVITDAEGGLVYSNLNVQTLSGSSSVFDNYSVDTGAVNAYIVSSATPLTSYVAGLRVAVKILNTNTGPSTLDYMGLGPKNIITQNGAALSGYELFAGGIFIFEYDGISFQIVSQFYMQGGDVTRYGAVGNGSVAGGTGTNDQPAFVTANGLGYPILVTHGKIYRISANLTLTQALIIDGGQISIDSGVTLTLNGPIEIINSTAPFVGPGYVIFNDSISRQGRVQNILPDRAAGVPVRGGHPYYAFGDSITAGNAAGGALCFTAIFAARHNCTENNYGVSGRGVTRATLEGFTRLPKWGSKNNVITWMAGFNDLHYQGSNPKTLVKLTDEAKAFLANCFLRTAVPTSDASVTKVGGWANGAAGVWGAKADATLGGFSMFSSTNTDKVTYTFNSNNIVIGYFKGSNTTYTLGNFDVYIDGVFVETISPNNTTDGNVGFPEVYQNLTHAVLVYPALGTGIHTIELRKTDNNLTVVDYFGILEAPADCPSVIMSEIPYVNEAGYAGPEALRSKIIDNAGSAAIRTGLEVFRVLGYPIAWVPVNDYYNYQANIFSDNVHPGVLGHAQIAAGFSAYTWPVNDAHPTACSFTKSAAQAIANTTQTAVTWSAVVGEPDFFAAGTPDRIIAPMSGTMRISGIINWAANAVGVRLLEVKKNGSGARLRIADSRVAVTGGSETALSFSFDVPVVTGDYFILYVTQSSGGNLNVQTDSQIDIMMIR